MNHFGDNLSEKDIWDKHKSFKGRKGPKRKGFILNPIISLGVTALNFGFDVTYVGYNPIIVNNNSSEDLKKSLKEKSKIYFNYGKFCVDETSKFLELGGKIKIDKLNVEKIKKLVSKNEFVLAEIKPAFVSKKGSINMNHKVIVIGYTKKGFKILNPSDAKEYFWDFDTFLLAFYAAIPELLIIKKKG